MDVLVVTSIRILIRCVKLRSKLNGYYYKASSILDLLNQLAYLFSSLSERIR